MKKIFNILMMLLVSITLVSCTNDKTPMVEPDTPFDVVKKTDFTELFNDQFELNLEANISTLIPPAQEGVGLNVLLENIDIKLGVIGNLASDKEADLLLNINFNIKKLSLQGTDPETGEVIINPWIHDINLDFKLAYQDGYLISMFESVLYFGEYVEDSDKERYSTTLNEFLGGVVGSMVGGMIPEEFKDIYDMVVNLLTDHKEKMFVGTNLIIQNALKQVVVDYFNLFTNLLDETLFNESPFQIDIVDTGLKFTKKDDLSLLFSEFELNYLLENNKFKGLNLDLKLPFGENIDITLKANLKTNSTLDKTIDHSEIEQVDLLQIVSKLIKNPQ